MPTYTVQLVVVFNSLEKEQDKLVCYRGQDPYKGREECGKLAKGGTGAVAEDNVIRNWPVE